MGSSRTHLPAAPAAASAAASVFGERREAPWAAAAGAAGSWEAETPLEVLREFALGTTLHGVRYIARPPASLPDRLCWAAAVVTCAVCATVFVVSAWQSFQSSPTVTAVENTHYPLHAFPFPAVTVCPANRVRRSVGVQLLREFLEQRAAAGLREVLAANASAGGLVGGLDGALLDVASAFSLYFHPFLYRMEPFLQRARPLLPLLANLSISRFMRQALPPCETLFRRCYWHGNAIDCCKEMHLQRTESGFCYSFNSLSSEDARNCSPGLGLRLGRRPGADEAAPGCALRRNTAVGSISGIEFFMHHTPDGDELPEGRQRDRKGFRVTIHHPSDIPEGGKDLYVAQREEGQAPRVFSLKVSPQATVGTAALRGVAPDQRGCFFPEEGRLAIFHTYTIANCMVECRQRYLATHCRCRTYFFDSIGEVWLRFVRAPEDEARQSEEDARSQLDCSHCLPTCHDMRYDVDASTSDDSNPSLPNSSAYMDVFYKDLGAVKYRRDVAFGTMQLLVSFGGIMGLFLGVSILSGVELLYYLLRLLLATARRVRACGHRPLALAPAHALALAHGGPARRRPWGGGATISPGDYFFGKAAAKHAFSPHIG